MYVYLDYKYTPILCKWPKPSFQCFSDGYCWCCTIEMIMVRLETVYSGEFYIFKFKNHYIITYRNFRNKNVYKSCMGNIFPLCLKVQSPRMLNNSWKIDFQNQCSYPWLPLMGNFEMVDCADCRQIVTGLNFTALCIFGLFHMNLV